MITFCHKIYSVVIAHHPSLHPPVFWGYWIRGEHIQTMALWLVITCMICFQGVPNALHPVYIAFTLSQRQVFRLIDMDPVPPLLLGNMTGGIG